MPPTSLAMSSPARHAAGGCARRILEDRLTQATTFDASPLLDLGPTGCCRINGKAGRVQRQGCRQSPWVRDALVSRYPQRLDQVRRQRRNIRILERWNLYPPCRPRSRRADNLRYIFGHRCRSSQRTPTALKRTAKGPRNTPGPSRQAHAWRRFVAFRPRWVKNWQHSVS